MKDTTATKARMLLRERGEFWTDERIELVLPDVRYKYSEGAGTLENAVNISARVFERDLHNGKKMHGSLAKERGF